MLNGGIFLYPTDTIWGLGCLATNEQAIEKIRMAKERVPEKSFIILVESMERLKNYVDKISPKQKDFLLQSERPTTVIFQKVKNLPSALLAKDGSLGIRMVRMDFCEKLISQINGPLVSTSANISGEASPAAFGEISEKLKDRVDFVVNPALFEEKSNAKASRIVKFNEMGGIEIIRD